MIIMEYYIIQDDVMFDEIKNHLYKKVKEGVEVRILYDELVEGKINAPKHILGNHDYGEGQMITTYKPHSDSCKVVLPDGKKEYDMDKIDDKGFYALYLTKKQIKGNHYCLKTVYQDGSVVTTADPYSFDGQLTDYDIHLF